MTFNFRFKANIENKCIIKEKGPTKNELMIWLRAPEQLLIISVGL